MAHLWHTPSLLALVSYRPLAEPCFPVFRASIVSILSTQCARRPLFVVRVRLVRVAVVADPVAALRARSQGARRNPVVAERVFVDLGGLLDGLGRVVFRVARAAATRLGEPRLDRGAEARERPRQRGVGGQRRVVGEAPREDLLRRVEQTYRRRSGASARDPRPRGSSRTPRG